MENDRWQAEYQQSVAAEQGLERTDNSLNNGNGFEISAGSGEFQQNVCIKDDPENEIPMEESKFEDPTKYTISEEAKQTIRVILEQVKSLSQIEKFLLYLKLPAEISNPVDPFRHPLNPLGSRAEIYRTICWIKTHLEEDPDISLPKQEVYTGYYHYCEKINIKPLSQADFGKVMKQVYPKVRARRLGTRGNSRYCYSGLRRCSNLKPPVLPDLSEKPLSTEVPFTHNNLTSAAWLIVRDWSQQQLGIQFSSLQALAYYLILHHSIGAGTEAASKLTSAAESKIKGEETQTNGKGGNKHREMQLQLQRKIQQKNEGKEKKRKIQTEQKPGCKKSRSHSTPTPSTASTSPQGVPNGNSGSASNGTSPTQGRTVCDKTDFTQLPALPDFNSIQRPAAVELMCAGNGVTPDQGTAAEQPTSKMPIPRLPPTAVAAAAAAATPSIRPALKKPKYKTIQPRLQEPCDIVTYNPPEQPVAAADPRSQNEPDLGSFKENKPSEDVDNRLINDVCDDISDDFPLTRERLNSVSTVAKDAMDEYLGTNNSQHEHEEELSKYFNNTDRTLSTASIEENTTKLSTLRQLLERNGITDNKANIESILNPTVVGPLPELSSAINGPAMAQPPVEHVPTAVTAIPRPSQNLPSITSHVKRRVSFETLEDTVPPSPNTRRKNFSFTPISPGPPSPTGSHSKCSSTNASPFVSPRSTPIARPKNNAHQNAGIMLSQESRKTVKVKKDADLLLEVPTEQAQFTAKNYVAMSAPASPMLSNSSVLQKLLNSNNKVPYRPGYTAVPLTGEANPEVAGGQVVVDNIQDNLDLLCRSQSVPLNQMLKNNNYAFIQNLRNEFSGLVDPLPEPENENVKLILNSLDEQACENNNIDMLNLDITANNQCLPSFGLHLDNNNIELSNSFPSSSFENIEMPNPRVLVRSQSIQHVDTNFKQKFNPSRSVPNTPLPFSEIVKQEGLPVKNFPTSSRSYPSTPLTSEEAFTYNNINGDCLLNGQPIRADNIPEDMQFVQNLDMNNCEDNIQEKGFGLEGEFGLIENDGTLMDDDGILIPQNYSGHIN